MAKAPRPTDGDRIVAGYLYDESQLTFVVGPDWSRSTVDTMARLVGRAGALPEAVTEALATAPSLSDLVASWSDDDVQAVDVWCLNSEAGRVADFPEVPLNTPPADGTGGEDTTTSGETGADTTTASEGGDTQSGSETGTDTTTASEGGDDTIVADDTATDTVAGGEGGDTLAGDGATDTVAGGQGDDTAHAADAGAGDAGAAGQVDAGAGGGSGLEDGARECLTDMRDSKYGLYRWPGEKGEVSQFGASGPQYDGELVRDLVESGLAAIDETGGNHGSVKITDQGRAALVGG